MKLLRFGLFLLALAFLLGCKNPQRPTPLPTSSPSPLPSPPSATFLSPLSVAGHEFHNSRGETVYLLGAVHCCGEPVGNGWPLISNSELDLIGDAGLNYAHMRIGPFLANMPEGSQFAFDSPSLFSSAQGALRKAQENGIYIEVALFDFWCAQHNCGFFALDELQGIPSDAQVQWVRKVVGELGGAPNLLWVDGNETFKRASFEWTLGIMEVVRDEERRRGFVQHPFGTNSQDGRIEGRVDFAERHSDIPQNAEGNPFPIMNNEYGELGADEILFNARRARDLESSFHIWRGSLSDADYRWLLKEVGKVRNGG